MRCHPGGRTQGDPPTTDDTTSLTTTLQPTQTNYTSGRQVQHLFLQHSPQPCGAVASWQHMQISLDALRHKHKSNCAPRALVFPSIAAAAPGSTHLRLTHSRGPLPTHSHCNMTKGVRLCRHVPSQALRALHMLHARCWPAALEQPMQHDAMQQAATA